MSFMLTREGIDPSYYFSVDQWLLYLETMASHGWVPVGTERYEVHEVVGPLDSVLKDSYSVPVEDAVAFGLTPETLAKHVAEHGGGSYCVVLETVREEWKTGELWIPSTPDRRWAGSYTLNEGQYVNATDAGNMAKALLQAAAALENGSIRLKGKADGGATRTVSPSEFGLMEAGEKEGPHLIAEGPAALRELASWMTKGEFRIC